MRFLFVDRILQLIPGKSIQGLKHITRDEPWLSVNEQEQLAFIPSFIGETLGQLTAWNVMFTNNFSLRPVAGIVQSAQLHRSAILGETLFLESFIDYLDDKAVEYHSQAWIGTEKVFTIEGALGPLLPMTDFIDAAVVKSQFNSINRPGIAAPLNSADTIIATQDLPSIQLAFDKIISIDIDVGLIAEKYITGTAPWFADHFPNKPVLPLTVLLECKINLAYNYIKCAGFTGTYQVCELRKIKMNDFVFPGDIVRCTVKVKSHDKEELILSFRSEVDGKRVCVLEIIMSKQS